MIQIDMEMPDSCRECWFLKYDMYSGETSCVIGDMILARYFKELDFEGRHEECPLVNVPDAVSCSEFPNSCENLQSTCNEVATDCISRQTTADEIGKRAERCAERFGTDDPFWEGLMIAKNIVECVPSEQPEQRYTKEELSVFKHGISLSLLSKRSAQHWHYDEDTATEIKFLERLYEKVGADMRGEQE